LHVLHILAVMVLLEINGKPTLSEAVLGCAGEAEG
jgi:hypothetical protein